MLKALLTLSSILLFTLNVYGAEALVMIRNNDWIKGRAQDGAIIMIQPDGFEWGRREKQRFVIIKVPDSMLKNKGNHIGEIISGYDMEGKPITNGRRKYVYEYWTKVNSATLAKIKAKKNDNIYTHLQIKSKDVKKKDADNNTIGNYSPVVTP